jgi:two-component system osmolarity sensor histidine kinase EnvZ
MTDPPPTPAAPSRPSSPVPDSTRAALPHPGGVFWRTFLLIAVLIAVSLAACFQSFRVLERGPRAQQAAQLIVSVVNLTRAALIHSDPDKRRALLIDLEKNEGVRIYPLEVTDQTTPLPDNALLHSIVKYVRSHLGSSTQITLARNGQSGLWVSFAIDDDAYWVEFDAERLQSLPTIEWLRWSLVALVLSMLGAVVISRLINLPLSRLTSAALAVGAGQRPAPLPESGPREIREANASFNAMVGELERIEADRALLLAGISHDLRTPLTRLRLEVEINELDAATREAMSADIEQMDAIIGQFLDYARPIHEKRDLSEVDLALLVRETVEATPTGDSLTIATHFAPARTVTGNRTELKRVLLNLIENARRYAHSPGADAVAIEISVSGGEEPVLEVRDHGPGIAAGDIERLKRPFTRLDEARGQANGAGLGLAIVERVAERHHARFELGAAPGGGLCARLIFARRGPG